jgi:MFS transporter, putative metabolite:H+ symporter
VETGGLVTAIGENISRDATPGGILAGPRLDRLPISSFHKRIFWLIGAGMFFDGYDLYVGTNVLGATLASGFSTLAQNAQFVSMTFVGMTIGALAAGFLGDAFGRRFTYQVNLLVFGLASFAAVLAPTMFWLVAARFVMGLGLGAEIVVGYSTLTEFVPPISRGRWLSFMTLVVVSGLPATTLLGSIVIPTLGWRPVFLIAGIGALVVWYLRKSMPESPRWLESKRRFSEAEELITMIEGESASLGLLPIPKEATTMVNNLNALDLFGATLLPRLLVGSIGLIVINTLIFGFVTWLPTFFIHQGLTLTRSFAYTLMISSAAPIGCVIGAFAADRIGRRPTIIGGSLLAIVFGGLYPNMMQPLLHVLVALLYGVYTPELFPTELRLRANGICNMLGRGATIVSPFIVVTLFKAYGVAGVTSFMIGLLIVLIAAIWAWGVEPAGLALEDIGSARPKSDLSKVKSLVSKAR